ncbi:MAG: GIY-YIG nuclease family protein [Acidobacteriaceae bacterium]
MISLNSLLRHESIDPAFVKLLRHQDTRYPGRPSPYSLWISARDKFELYQSIQRRPVFHGARHLASFVATPLNETLFAGIYAVNSVGTAAAGLKDPISHQDVGGFNLYDLALDPALRDYRGRMIIDWGRGYLAWMQLAARQDKEILEIRRDDRERPFPGLLDFRQHLSNLADVPTSWREVLSSVAGIYLLIHLKDGRQYVGSAQGEQGFWGRWEQYVANGHGGNQLLRELPPADYQVSILEVASSSATVDQILALEARWKQKLLSQLFGLNAN